MFTRYQKAQAMSQLSRSSKQSIIQADIILQSQFAENYNLSSTETSKQQNKQNEVAQIKNQGEESDIQQQTFNKKAFQTDSNNHYPNIQPCKLQTKDNESFQQKKNMIKDNQQNSITEAKAKTEKQSQILKKIKNNKKGSQIRLKNHQSKNKESKKNIQKIKGTRSEQKNQQKFIQKLLNRKKLPQKLQTSSQDQQTNNKNRQATIPSKSSAANLRNQIISNFRKNKYRKKNYVFQDKITKIKEIKANQNKPSSNNLINITGQIIFTWSKHLINEKWAKTQMISLQVYDGTGCILVVIPVKFIVNNESQYQFTIGKYIQIKKAQIRQRYPKKVCLLVGQKTKINFISKNLAPKQSVLQAQKLGLSLKQLQKQPIGRTCTIVCIVLSKSQKQYIRSFKNNDLDICKLTVYDPIDKILITIRLWEQKTNIRFYTNGIVYLLRGIQIKQFKGNREYHASKDFNYRMLSWSRIQQYLLPLYNARQKCMQKVPKQIGTSNINDLIVKLNKMKARSQVKMGNQIQKAKKIGEQSNKKQQYNKKLRQLSPIEKLQNLTYTQNKQANIKTGIQNSKLIMSPFSQRQQCSSKKSQIIYSLWSISTIKIQSLQIKSNYQIKYTKCLKCQSRAMRNCYNQALCLVCQNSIITNTQISRQAKQSKVISQYSIKCEFYDGCEVYLGQLCEKAASKIFSIQDSLMKLQFFEQLNCNFREQLARQILGDTVKAIIMTTKEKIDVQNTPNIPDHHKNIDSQHIQKQRQQVWVTAHYIVDIVPFQDEITTQHSNLQNILTNLGPLQTGDQTIKSIYKFR